MPTIPRTLASAPGQLRPRPSPIQKMPKPVTKTPTSILIAFWATAASCCASIAPVTTSYLGQLLAPASELEDLLNKLIARSSEDIWAQQQADWAWFRFASINVLVRGESGGPLASVLARGLLEQAAYWDWALATGAGADHLPRWAAIEYERLEQIASAVRDTTWLGWILPLGTEIVSDGADGIPANPADAVGRLGGRFTPAVVAPLEFDGLFAA
jgi:hypothetical protein